MIRNLFTSATLLFSIICFSPSANAQVVTFDTNFGDIVVELFPEIAPLAVDNFLGYVTRGDYDDTIFHRSVSDFIIQGGGFNSDFTPVPALDPIINEFQLSNLRGTLATATLGGNPDSATSQFFFNLVDSNSNFLDAQNGGFTVFGEIVTGLEVIDSISGLATFNASDIGNVFGELPVSDNFENSLPLTPDDLVVINRVTINSIPEPTSLIVVSACSALLLTRRRRS